MTKTMCKKSHEKRAEVLKMEPHYTCKKCNAMAPKKKHLCKPEKVKSKKG